MNRTQPPFSRFLTSPLLALAAVFSAVLSGCATHLPPAEPLPPLAQPPMTPVPDFAQDTPGGNTGPGTTPAANVAVSRAQTPREYRADAATHLYAKNSHRIYKGPMPPLLYAVGVLQVNLDRKGMVSSLGWMRAPTHAPEVVAEIERTVRDAAPYPIAAQLGRVTYTDTWLWDRSGKFQLDTLTEGQLSEAPEPNAPTQLATSDCTKPKSGRRNC